MKLEEMDYRVYTKFCQNCAHVHRPYLSGVHCSLTKHNCRRTPTRMQRVSPTGICDKFKKAE